MENPWKTLNSRYIYKNDWIRLREDQVITPAGKPGIYSVVETHPAIGIVALDEDGYVWLVGQYRYPLNTYSWEIPEGGAHEGETPAVAARRELLEETGLRAEKWTPLGEIYTSNCFTDEIATLFLAEGLTAGLSNPDPTEQLQVKRLHYNEVCRMISRGEIKDAMSIIALSRVQGILEKRGFSFDRLE